MSLELFSPLLGCSVFNAKKGHGSFVTFSLTATPDTPAELFYFWVYMCHWEIRESERELAHSESEDNEIGSAVSALNGRRLKGLNFHQWLRKEELRHGVSLVFEGELIMRLVQYEDRSSDDPVFSTRSVDGEWISYLSSGSIE